VSASSAAVSPGRFRGAVTGRSLVGAAVVAASVALGLVGYRVLVEDHGQHPDEAMAQVAVGWTFVATGLVGWWRRPASRVGPLLAAAGVALLVRRLQYSDDSAIFTFGFSLGELSNALIAHAILGYPSGRLQSLERRLIGVGYALVLAFPVATLVVYDAASTCFFDCGDQSRARSLLLVGGDDGLAHLLRDGYRVSVFGLLGVAVIALIVRKLVRATPAARRMLAPMLVAGILAATRAVSEGALTFADYSEETRRVLFWWQVSAQAILPLALLVGLLQTRLAHAALADRLLPRLDATPPQELRGALARALGDPTLELAFWLPERESYVGSEGEPVTLPEEDRRRYATRLEHDGEPIAALVHDRALTEDPALVEAAAAAARIALENARLHAEVQAQLASVRESRARIVAAADTERRRIERDLHDGAQQRLLALALELRTAQHRLREGADADVEQVLGSAVDELQEAVRDLRELTHGLHPTILAEQGLEAALGTLAARTRLPVSVAVEVGERLPAPQEAAAYFVACEAVTNVVKHANASQASVAVTRRDGRIRVEVADDGVGGADPHGGGLRGLADRVEALGGRLRVQSPHGKGTRIVGEIPCGS
jgi:signal transduction histidine kinase